MSALDELPLTMSALRHLPRQLQMALMKRSVERAKHLVDQLQACEQTLFTLIFVTVRVNRAEPVDTEDPPVCPICLDTADEDDRHWVKLGCGHWYCEACLCTHVRAAEVAFNKCPMCRGAIADSPAVHRIDEEANALANALDCQMDFLTFIGQHLSPQEHTADGSQGSAPILQRSESNVFFDTLDSDEAVSTASDYDAYDARAALQRHCLSLMMMHKARCILAHVAIGGYKWFAKDDGLWWWRVLWSLRFGSVHTTCAKLPSSWGCARAGVIG